MKRSLNTLITLLPLSLGLCIFLLPTPTSSETADNIRAAIEDNSEKIEILNKEIATYEKQLTKIGTKKQTLKNTIDQLNIQRKKITASIGVTKNKIKTLQLQIQSLTRNIEGKQGSIRIEHAGIAETFRRINERDIQTLATVIFSSDDITNIWNDINAMQTLQESMRIEIENLSLQKKSLADTKTATEKKRIELVVEQNNLVAEQGSLDATSKAQNELLAQTKSQESTFQSILVEKQTAKANFEASLSDLQGKLKDSIDPSSIPPAGKGILRWPLENVKITQNFGNTDFARSGGYAGRGHNGIDLRAQVGTPVKAALTGTVLDVGNTDSVRGCYSYGKWAVIKHSNGLATLYAHLSQANISAGQSVSTGQVVGYSGATGYATGPHLHFGVYVASSVQIVRLGSVTNKITPCSNAVIPIAPLSGYLNPMEYL